MDNPATPDTPIATLVVTLTAGGQVRVDGPIDNRVICLGLLELAKEALAKHEQSKQNRIVQPPPGLKLI